MVISEAENIREENTFSHLVFHKPSLWFVFVPSFLFGLGIQTRTLPLTATPSSTLCSLLRKEGGITYCHKELAIQASHLGTSCAS